MKIVGDSAVPNGKISFKTIEMDIQANIDEYTKVGVQFGEKTSLSWESHAIRYDKTSDKWFFQTNDTTYSFSRCTKTEALEAAKLPDLE